jgi:dihydrodipicolinate synthase/N-acetylneuraminate lyase
MPYMTLTAESLRGIYAFVPVPWDEDYELDVDALEDDVDYLSKSPVSGIYTPDSSGEFFALSFDEFTQVVDIVVDVADGRDVDVQIGCHCANPNGAFERARYAASKDVDAIKVLLSILEQSNHRRGNQVRGGNGTGRRRNAARLL